LWLSLGPCNIGSIFMLHQLHSWRAKDIDKNYFFVQAFPRMPFVRFYKISISRVQVHLLLFIRQYQKDSALYDVPALLCFVLLLWPLRKPTKSVHDHHHAISHDHLPGDLVVYFFPWNFVPNNPWRRHFLSGLILGAHR